MRNFPRLSILVENTEMVTTQVRSRCRQLNVLLCESAAGAGVGDCLRRTRETRGLGDDVRINSLSSRLRCDDIRHARILQIYIVHCILFFCHTNLVQSNCISFGQQ